MRCILFIVALLFDVGICVSAYPVKEFYVSREGKSGNAGTKNQPFLTLKEARQAIRTYLQTDKNGGKQNIIVWIRNGTYELSESFELTKEDSGTEMCRIVYQAYPGEKVTFTGGRILSSSIVHSVMDDPAKSRFVDQSFVGNIKSIDLKALGTVDYGKNQITGFRRPYVNAAMELFINGKPFHLARYPNKNQIRINTEDVIDPGMVEKDFHPGCILFDKHRLALWSKAQDIFTCGNFKYAWATDQLRVKEMDTNTGEVKFADAHMFGISGEHEWNQYYYFNLLEEIDEPGEYYIDHQKEILYFYPFTQLQPTDTIEVSMLEDALVTLKGADYVSFKNLTFEAGRGIGIYMENTVSAKIENCTIRNMGVVGVCVGKGSQPSVIYRHPDEQHPFFPTEKLSGRIGSLYDYLYENTTFDREGGKENGIVNCFIENTGCGGVSIGGGNRLTLEKAGNYVDNCEFTNCGRLDYSYKSPVNIDGVGNRISHCQFNSCPATAIYIHGNDHAIEYNVIDGACKFMDDQGAVYLGRDPSEFGNIIRYNFFKNIGNIGTTMAVYFDDGACGTECYGNVFYKAGTHTVLVGGGQFNKIENNIFIDSELAVHLDNRLENWAKKSLLPGSTFELRMKTMNFQKPPFAEKYPQMINYFDNEPAIPKRNDIKNNVFVRVKQVHNGKKEWGPVLDTNLITDRDVKFKNADQLDFTLKKHSEVFRKLPEFKPIPFEQIGRNH